MKTSINKENTYLLIDICGTYVTENTTFGLILNHFPSKSLKGLLIRLFIFRFSPVNFIIIILEKVTNFQILKNILILFLRGVHVKDLSRSANNYAKKILKNRNKCNKKVFDFINFYKENSIPVFISASIDPIVKAISLIENIPFISSKISVVNNIYNGKILLDISKSKDSELLKKFNIDLNKIKYYLVTDNFDDLRYARNSLKTLFILERKNSILCKDLFNAPNVEFVFR